MPDGNAHLDFAAAVARLAALLPHEYDRIRKDEAEALGIRVGTLDAEVARVRGDAAGPDAGQGRALRIDRPEPWPEPVDGADLLAAMADFFAAHVFLPTSTADVLAVWVLHTYCYVRFRHSPRIAVVSPEKGCGKTTVLDTLQLLVCAPLPTANITGAALFRTIEIAGPTLLVDEADTFLRNSEEMRGITNAGHKRGGQVIRCVGDNAEPRSFSVFGPMAIAAIGKLPETTTDRSLIVRMRRAMRSERPAPLDAAAEAAGAVLARRCARWTADHEAVLDDAVPALPTALFNRSADNWRPLFSIAEAAGPDWPARLTSASAAMVPAGDADGQRVRLLADIRATFATDKPPFPDKLSSAELCVALNERETSPWAEMNHGRGITMNGLARLLRPFGIQPGSKRAGHETFKGYLRDAFAEAWLRYLDDEPAGEGANIPSHRHNR